MKVTDEHVHYSKVLPELVENITKSDNMTAAAAIGKLFGDGAYEGNDIFRYLADKGIQPCIKVQRMLKSDGKRETSLEIYPCWHKEMICKSGRIA